MMGPTKAWEGGGRDRHLRLSSASTSQLLRTRIYSTIGGRGPAYIHIALLAAIIPDPVP